VNVVTFNLRAPVPRIAPPRKRITAPRRGDRGARQLALAYRIEQAIESGELRDLTHAAEVYGVTKARIAQVNALLVLSPELQARVLAGENIHERSLRAATRFVDWNEQVAALKDKVK
jgi:hypothetical protein